MFEGKTRHKIPFYKGFKNGVQDDCIAKRFGISYAIMEAVRRSEEWHDAVADWDIDGKFTEELVLDPGGRHPKAKSDSTVNVKLKPPDGFEFDGTPIVGEPVVEKRMWATYTISVELKTKINTSSIVDSLKNLSTDDLNRVLEILNQNKTESDDF